MSKSTVKAKVKHTVKDTEVAEPESRNLKAGDVVEKEITVNVTEDAAKSDEQLDHIVTGDDLKNNPELQEQGVKEGDEIIIPAGAGTQSEPSTESVDDTVITDKMKPYLAHYPNEKAFHLTSDGSVFFEANKGDAIYHQTQTDNNKKIITYEVK